MADPSFQAKGVPSMKTRRTLLDSQVAQSLLLVFGLKKKKKNGNWRSRLLILDLSRKKRGTFGLQKGPRLIRNQLQDLKTRRVRKLRPPIQHPQIPVTPRVGLEPSSF